VGHHPLPTTRRKAHPSLPVSRAYPGHEQRPATVHAARRRLQRPKDPAPATRHGYAPPARLRRSQARSALAGRPLPWTGHPRPAPPAGHTAHEGRCGTLRDGGPASRRAPGNAVQRITASRLTWHLIKFPQVKADHKASETSDRECPMTEPPGHQRSGSLRELSDPEFFTHWAAVRSRLSRIPAGKPGYCEAKRQYDAVAAEYRRRIDGA
jgi:hypothetical protein